jgi:hypothetical protein
MKTLSTLVMTALVSTILSVPSAAASGPDDIPHYCKTDVGVLGPYPNDGSVRVGDPCYGTKNGRQYYGVAVMNKSGDDSASSGRKDRDGSQNKDDDIPHYCKTEVGVLGPYPNDGSVRVGDPCYGTKNGRQYYGTAVMRP